MTHDLSRRLVLPEADLSTLSRRQVLASAGVALAAVTVSPLEALAGRSLKRSAQFIAWSGSNPDIFCMKYVNPQKGNTLEVAQLGVPKPLESMKNLRPDQEKMVFERRFADYDLIVPGNMGLKAPNGWEVFGQYEASKNVLRVGLSNGRDAMELGRVQARPDTASNTHAQARVTNAAWTQDSMRVVVIINQFNNVSGFTLDRDEIRGFDLNKVSR